MQIWKWQDLGILVYCEPNAINKGRNFQKQLKKSGLQKNHHELIVKS